MLTDWVRYELKNNQEFDSSIWTNIVFKVDGLNETISKRVGKDVDVSKYLHICEEDFFRDEDCVYWWKKFPNRSVIIIDEVHFYLGKKVEHGSLDLESELVNWLSTHRHGQQEIYFLSQHTDQFANQVLGIADQLLEIVNVKSLVLPFPISVPMADFDEVKRSFGIKTQYYQANIGNFRGKAVKWNGAVQRYLMTSDIFRVYKSHDAGVEESDRPQLKMSPLEALLWFTRRHGWHLIPKVACVPLLLFVGVPMLFSVPDVLAKGMMKDVEGKEKQTTAAIKKQNGQIGQSDSRSIGSVGTSAESEIPGNGEETVRGSRHSEEVGEAWKTTGIVKAVNVKIVMLFEGGVMLDDGRKIAVADVFEYEGRTETLLDVNVGAGIVVFESGRKVRF
jgi:hypothetical protein